VHACERSSPRDHLMRVDEGLLGGPPDDGAVVLALTGDGKHLTRLPAGTAPVSVVKGDGGKALLAEALGEWGQPSRLDGPDTVPHHDRGMGGRCPQADRPKPLSRHPTGSGSGPSCAAGESWRWSSWRHSFTVARQTAASVRPTRPREQRRSRLVRGQLANRDANLARAPARSADCDLDVAAESREGTQ
jgi:hypothetical protein